MSENRRADQVILAAIRLIYCLHFCKCAISVELISSFVSSFVVPRYWRLIMYMSKHAPGTANLRVLTLAMLLMQEYLLVWECMIVCEINVN
jgi:hypothetical protein